MIRLEHDKKEAAIVAWDLHTHAIVGLLYYRIVPSSVEITGLFVNKGRRRRGTASKMFETLFSLYSPPFFVTTLIGNHPAIATYQSVGFKICGRSRFEPVLVMEKLS